MRSWQFSSFGSRKPFERPQHCSSEEWPQPRDCAEIAGDQSKIVHAADMRPQQAGSRQQPCHLPTILAPARIKRTSRSSRCVAQPSRGLGRCLRIPVRRKVNCHGGGLSYRVGDGKASAAQLSTLHTVWQAASLHHEHPRLEVRPDLRHVPVRVRRQLLDRFTREHG